jgi:hypothetical protein
VEQEKKIKQESERIQKVFMADFEPIVFILPCGFGRKIEASIFGHFGMEGIEEK